MSISQQLALIYNGGPPGDHQYENAVVFTELTIGFVILMGVYLIAERLIDWWRRRRSLQGK